jgi:uncharacterized membrane protein YczE
MWGLFLYALGVVFAINAHIGYAPWDVLHIGLANTIGLSIGIISIILGVFIVIIAVLLGEKVGIGTILNMIFVGLFFDMIYALKIIPVANNLLLGIIMLFIGLFIIAFATYFYIGTALGAGPRDSLMVALTRITGLPIGACRGIIELLVVLSGWMLGGMVGIGTVLAAFGIGFCIQIVFNLLKFDATKIKHETISYTYKRVFNKEVPGEIDKKEVFQNE